MKSINLTNKAEKMFHEIDIEINHACNRTCWYCPNDSKSRVEKGEMSLELFSELVKQLVELEYKGKMFFHFYNEPLLCSNLETFVEIVKNKLPEVKMELVSNGILLTKEKFLNLLKLGINFFTITKHHGVDRLMLEDFLPGMSDEIKSKINVKSYEKLNLTNRAGSVPEISKNKNLPLSRACLIPSCMVVITNKGSVVVCYEDYDQLSNMGNIKNISLKEIWNSEAYKNFREKLKKGERELFELCKSCDNTKLIQ